MLFPADPGSFEHFDTEVSSDPGTNEEIVLYRTFEGVEHMGVIMRLHIGWTGSLPIDDEEALFFHPCGNENEPCTVGEIVNSASIKQDNNMDAMRQGTEIPVIDKNDERSLYYQLHHRNPRRRLSSSFEP